MSMTAPTLKIASLILAGWVSGWIVIAVPVRASAADVCQPLAQALEDVLAKNSSGPKTEVKSAPSVVDQKQVLAPYGKEGPPTFKAQSGAVGATTGILKKADAAAAKKAGLSIDDYLTQAGPDGVVKTGGKIVSPQTVQSVSGDTKSFVVFKNKKMVVGESHLTLAVGNDVAAAGEVRIRMGVGADGKPVVAEVDINLQSGTYKIADREAAFRAAVQSLLDQGINPEKIILREFSEGGTDILKQKILATLTPPYFAQAVKSVTREERTAQVTADSHASGAAPSSPDSAAATIPKQAPQTYISGHYKEGGAFSGKVMHDDGKTILLQIKNGTDEPIVVINRDQIEPDSVTVGRVKAGALTPGGRKVTNAPGPESTSDALAPEIANPQKGPPEPSIQALNPEIKEGNYVSLAFKNNAGSREGIFVRETPDSVVLKDPVSQREFIAPKSRFELSKSQNLPTPKRESYFAFDPNDPKAAGQYFSNKYWTVWQPDEVMKLPRQGFKLHISAKPEDAHEVADVVLEELRKMRVAHKVATNPTAYAELKGKLITIYPENDQQAVYIAKRIDKLLQEKGLAGKTQPLTDELPVGTAGGVYARYGLMEADHLDGQLIVANNAGNAIDQSGQVILFNGKPISVNTPLDRNYNPDDIGKVEKLLQEKNALRPDSKEQFKPDWMDRDPFKSDDVGPPGALDVKAKNGQVDHDPEQKSVHISGGAEGSYGGTAGDLKFYAQTDHGMGHPQNEDAVFAGRTHDGSVVFVSVDGMSRPAAGRIAAETIANHMKEQLARGKTVEEALNSIPNALMRRLNKGSGALNGMGATLSSVEIKDGEAIFRHVGDAKGMVVRDGAVQFVTKDHSLYEEVMSHWDHGGREEKINELIRKKNIDRVQAEKQADQYYQEMKVTRGHSTVTRAYTTDGPERFEPNTVSLEKHDRVVLASDGLWDNMSQDQVAKIVNEASSPEDAAQKIREAVQKTMGTTGKPDNFNITVVFN